MSKNLNTARIVVISISIFICGHLLLKYGLPYLGWLSSTPLPIMIEEKTSMPAGSVPDTQAKAIKGKKVQEGEELNRNATVIVSRQSNYDIQSVAKLYETFAGFITTLLTIISGLGFLFAYIIRKNIKELETEIRTKGETQIKEMSKSMEKWETIFSDELQKIKKLKEETEINLKKLEDFLSDSIPEKQVESPQERAQELDLDEDLKDMGGDMGTENGN